MKQLFTNDLIIKEGFFAKSVCNDIEKKLLSNPEVFGCDTEPTYGSMAPFYGMIEAGLNESYFRYAKEHNALLMSNFPYLYDEIIKIGKEILRKSELPVNALPIVPRDKEYFLIGGFNIQKRSWLFYNAHTDTEGLIATPKAIFDPDTRAYSAVVSIKRTAQHTVNNGGDLTVWKVRLLADELDDFYKKDGFKVKKEYNPYANTIPYEVGNLVIFDSFMPHVVELFKVKEEKDYRISFVVHFNYRERTEVNPFPHLEFWF